MAHHSYIEHILWGLAEAEAPSDEVLIQAVKRAHLHPEKPFGSAIARLLEKHPRVAVDFEILEIIIWYALNGEANEDEVIEEKSSDREPITINTLIHRGGDIRIRGSNGDRSWAWEALGSVLWNVPEVEARVWEAIDIALEKELLISVRCSIMEPLSPLFNMNKERFADSIHRLIVPPDGTPYQHDTTRFSPLITHTGVHLFPYIFFWLPELAEELTRELLECEDETKELIGAWFIFRESFRNDAYVEKADNY